ncbi:MAG: hypothetical protein ACKVU4_14620 [Phycisphaerales bacterium]
MTHSNRVFAGRAIGVAAALVAPGAAHAQETAQLIVGVSGIPIGGGTSVVVSVSAMYSPQAGMPAVWNTLGGSGQLGIVCGFADAVFSVLAEPEPGVIGAWSFPQIGPGFSAFSSPGIINGNSVNGVAVATPAMPLFLTNNPVMLWTAMWTPSEFSAPGSVRISTDVLGIPGQYPDTVSLWLVNGQVGPVWQRDAWPCTDGQNVITVVPAPSAAVLCLGVVAAAARRRRSLLG